MHITCYTNTNIFLCLEKHLFYNNKKVFVRKKSQRCQMNFCNVKLDLLLKRKCVEKKCFFSTNLDNL